MNESTTGVSDVLPVRPVLSGEEYARIDAWAAGPVHDGEALVALLQTTFGVDATHDPDIVSGLVHDQSNLPGRAVALVRPRNARDCAAVFRACFRAGLPFTLSAGRTNLTGSATPPEGVVVSLANMVAPAAVIDRAARTARCPVGLRLEELRRLVESETGGALCFPVDPTSRADATVGGAIACNASGFTPGEEGAIRHWVTSLDIVLPDGYGLEARRGASVSAAGAFRLGHTGAAWPVPRYARPRVKNASGPFSAPDGALDVVDLFVGSEGLFGCVTSCTLRLAPRPEAYADLFVAFPSEDDALRLLAAMRGPHAETFARLTALEYFGVNCRRYMTHADRLFPRGGEVGLYIQQPAAAAEVEETAGRLLEIMGEAGCRVEDDAVLLLDNDRDRALFFEARHSMPANSLEVAHRRGSCTLMTDTVVPHARFAEFLERVHGAMAEQGMDYLSFGHLGDCHLHFMLLPCREQTDAAYGLYDRIVAVSAELGGCYSGEHGTGKRKRRDFERCYGAEAVAELRRVKAAVDPSFLLNRGNVVDPV